MNLQSSAAQCSAAKCREYKILDFFLSKEICSNVIGIWLAAI